MIWFLEFELLSLVLHFFREFELFAKTELWWMISSSELPLLSSFYFQIKFSILPLYYWALTSLLTSLHYCPCIIGLLHHCLHHYIITLNYYKAFLTFLLSFFVGVGHYALSQISSGRISATCLYFVELFWLSCFLWCRPLCFITNLFWSDICHVPLFRRASYPNYYMLFYLSAILISISCWACCIVSLLLGNLIVLISLMNSSRIFEGVWLSSEVTRI